MEDSKAVYRVPVDDSPVKGPSDALVTIIESSDFECPFCKRVGPTMKQLEAAYPGKLRFVFKHNPLPFHAKAMPAAIAAEEGRAQGGSAKFWEMHDRLFDSAPALDRPALEATAQAAGLDMNAFRKALDEQRHESRIKRDQALVNSRGRERHAELLRERTEDRRGGPLRGLQGHGGRGARQGGGAREVGRPGQGPVRPHHRDRRPPRR